MTDEERQRLCAALRAQVSWFYLDLEDACHGIVRPIGDVAADEIERLAALTRSDAKPVECIYGAKGEKTMVYPLPTLAQSDAEPDGWRLVPKEPTQAMLDAAWEARSYRDEEHEIISRDVWEAMLTAAPAPPAQSDAAPKNVRGMLEKAIVASTLPEHKAADAEFMRASIRLANEFAKDALAALAQSGAEPVRAFAKAVLHGDDEHKAWLLEAAEAFIASEPLPAPRGKGTQSDAEPAQPQTLREAAENLLIAIGMGWDLEGCAENLRAALTQANH